MRWTSPDPGELVTCDTTAAREIHVRRVTDLRRAKLCGHDHPKPIALCGCRIDYDTKAPIEVADCKSCVEILRKTP